MFADDCLLFGDATQIDALALKQILEEYEAVSRQIINFEKSTAFFSSNTSSRDRDLVSSILRVCMSIEPKIIWDFQILLVGGNGELFKD